MLDDITLEQLANEVYGTEVPPSIPPAPRPPPAVSAGVTSTPATSYTQTPTPAVQEEGPFLSDDELYSIAGEVYGEEPESKYAGLLGVGEATARGVVEGLTTELPHLFGQAVEFIEPDFLKKYADPGKAISDWAEEAASDWFGDPEYEGMEKIAYQGSKMFAPSIVPAGIFTTGARLLLGFGKTIKAAKAARLAGNVEEATQLFNKAYKTALKIGSAGTAGLFGLSQAQQTQETASKRADILEQQGKVEQAKKVREAGEGIIPYITGGIEAVGEYFGTKYLGKLFGLDRVTKIGAKKLLLDFFKTMGVEVGTEIGQNYGQALVEKMSEVRPDANPLQEAVDVIGPTMFLTTLTGVGGAAVQSFGEPIKKPEAIEAGEDLIPEAPSTDEIRTRFQSGEFSMEDLEIIKEIWSDEADVAVAVDEILAATEAPEAAEEVTPEERVAPEEEVAPEEVAIEAEEVEGPVEVEPEVKPAVEEAPEVEEAEEVVEPVAPEKVAEKAPKPEEPAAPEKPVAEEMPGETVADEVNKALPGHALKFDGVQIEVDGRVGYYQFTPQEGVIKDATFGAKSLDPAEVQKALEKKIKQFAKVEAPEKAVEPALPEAEKVEPKPKAEPKALSIEKGISLERAAELTGDKSPTAFQIRKSFDKMTLEEQNKVINNIKNEINELEIDKKKYLKLRKDAFVPDKAVYTSKIKDSKKLLDGKKKRLAEFEAKVEPKAEKVEPEVEVETKGKTKEVSVDIPVKKAEALTPKEQKAYLLEEIDKAIEVAKSGKREVMEKGYKHESTSMAIEREERNLEIYKGMTEKFGTVTIHVPGDGDFTILNNKAALIEFKKKVKSGGKSFPITMPKPKAVKKAPVKPTGKRITGIAGEYYNKFLPRKEDIIERKIDPDHPKRAVQWFKDGWFSEGHYLIKTGTKPKLKNPVETKDGPAFEPMLADAKKAKPAILAGETLTSPEPSGDYIPMVHIASKDNKIHWLYNARFIDSILTLHPGAKVAITESGPAFFSKGKDVIGMVMPVKILEEGGKFEGLTETAQEGYKRLYGKPKKAEPKPEVTFSTKAKPLEAKLSLKDIKSLSFAKRGLVLQHDNDTFSIVFPNNRGFHIKSVESLADEAKFVAAYGKQIKKASKEGKIAGAYTHKDKTIRIVKGVGDKWTISHEFYHFLEQSGLLTKSEINAVDRQAAVFNMGTKYSGQEGRARWVEHELEAREKKRQSAIGKIIQKIQDIVNGFSDLAAKTLVGIESGKIAARESRLAETQEEGIMFGTQDAYESITKKKELTPKQKEWLVKHYPKKLKKSDNTGATEARTNTNAAQEALHRHFTGFMYWVVDKNRPIQSVQNKLDKVTEDIDLFLRETQRPKITAARVKNFWDESVVPLLKEISRSDFSIPDIELYIHAVHARERNEAMRLANSKRFYDSAKSTLTQKDRKGWAEPLAEEPEQYNRALKKLFEKFKDNKKVQKIRARWDTFSERPSGMSDAEAIEILNEHKGDKKIEEIRKKVLVINNEKLDILYNAGILADKEYKAYKNKYEFYAPLYREGYEDQVQGTGKGLQPAGRPIKTAMGSTKNVVNILANTVSNYENAIDRAEKARSAKTLLNLIKENPDLFIWTIKPQKQTPRYDLNGNLRLYPDISSVSENEIRIMVDGKQYLIAVNRFNKDAMLMLRTLKAKDKSLGPIVNTLAKVNRWLARINTSWSPEFIVSNFARDIQTAGINIGDTGVDSKKVFRGAVDGIRAIYNVERGKSTGKEYEKFYERFKAAGGKIEWSDVHGNIESLASKITKELEMQQGKRPVRKIVTEWIQFIEDANTSIENGVRLHVFKLAVDSGKSDLKAAQIASDITVDFTKKGAGGPVINSLYLFANAGIQGSYRIMRAIGKSSKVRKMTGGVIGLGFTIGFLNSFAGVDDDGEDYFNKIDDFVRERNMIIMLPETKGKFVKIPLPWGYNFFFNIGTEASRVFTKENYDPLEGASRLGSTFVNAFNPVASGTLLQTLSPTISDPFAMVAENKNWFGGDLMPTPNKFEKIPTPDSQRYWKSAKAESKWITKQLNDLTGGSTIRPGAIDVSPETLDLIVDTTGGSMLRFFRDSFAIPGRLIKQEEIKMYEVPFLRRVAGEQSEWADSRVYFENLQDILIAKEELKTYRGTSEYNVLKEKLTPFIKMFNLAEASEKRLRKLRKLKKKYDLYDDKKRVELYEQKINDEYVRFNKRFYNVMKTKKKVKEKRSTIRSKPNTRSTIRPRPNI